LRVEPVPLYSSVFWIIYGFFGHTAKRPFANGKVGVNVLAEIAYPGVVTGFRQFNTVGAEQYKIRFAAFIKNKLIAEDIKNIIARYVAIYSILKADLNYFWHLSK